MDKLDRAVHLQGDEGRECQLTLNDEYNLQSPMLINIES